MKSSITLKVCLAVLVLIAISLVLYPIFARPTGHRRPSCLSHLKQVAISNILYAGDFDDNLPPYYTFDLPKNWDSLSPSQRQSAHPGHLLIEALYPYSKNRDIFLCPQDMNPPQLPGAEGIPGELSYVHSLSLRGLIPGYDKGRRVLDMAKVAKPDSQVLMRDPIRGTNDKGLVSPHEGGFTCSYLDGHTKFQTELSPSQL